MLNWRFIVLYCGQVVGETDDGSINSFNREVDQLLGGECVCVREVVKIW